jgi:hypothetical protein
MNASPAKPCSNPSKGIAACFAHTVRSNARRSSNKNLVAPEKNFRHYGTDCLMIEFCSFRYNLPLPPLNECRI